MAPKRKRKPEAGRGRKRTPEQKIAEKAAHGRRDQQKIHDVSNRPKKKNPEPQRAAYRKAIVCCSMLLLMCPLQRSQVAQVTSLANGVVAGGPGRPIECNEGLATPTCTPPGPLAACHMSSLWVPAVNSAIVSTCKLRVSMARVSKS